MVVFVVKKVDLTFGIPMYNAEKYICELISCFKKTDKFIYEIIIVDDGSTDNSLNICKNINNKHLRIISQKNSGVSCARNKIIEKARGKWITFIDADDLIVFNKYEELFVEVKKNKYDYYFGIRNKKYFNSNTKKLHYLIEHELINSPWNKFYKKEILDKYQIRFRKQFNLGEDLLFNLEYMKQIQKVKYYYSNNMYIMRDVNINSLTHKYRENKFEELMKVNKICKKLFNDTKSVRAFEYIRIKNSLSCIKDIVKISDRSNLEKYNYIKNLRRANKRKYFILNSFFSTLIYNIWYLCPIKLLQSILGFMYKTRNDF